MSDVVVLYPVPPDRVVIDPATGRALRPDGSAVTMDAFWRRRLKAGVVADRAERREEVTP